MFSGSVRDFQSVAYTAVVVFVLMRKCTYNRLVACFFTTAEVASVVLARTKRISVVVFAWCCGEESECEIGGQFGEYCRTRDLVESLDAKR